MKLTNKKYRIVKEVLSFAMSVILTLFLINQATGIFNISKEVKEDPDKPPIIKVTETKSIALVEDNEKEVKKTRVNIKKVVKKKRPKKKREKVAEVKEEKIIQSHLGAATIKLKKSTLTQYSLPSAYYSGVDFSTFKPYEDYRKISNPCTPAYAVTHAEKAYTDENGFRRYKTNDKNQVTVDGKDDYIVAMGTFYKNRESAGDRYLVVTTTGMFTCIAGDTKSDRDTDQHNMFGRHGQYAGLIEYVVDTYQLSPSVKKMGSVTNGPVEEFSGDILHIYKIEEA